jgi:hypothetical protein
MINYDLERLSLLDWDHGDYLSDLTCTHLIRQPGVFELACNQLASTEVDGDGVLLVLIFETIGVGFPDVTITEATFFDAEGDMSYPQRQNGVVEVTNAPTYTSTPSITPTRTITSTPTVTPNPTATPTETSTATVTPFLSPTTALTVTETAEPETPNPNTRTAAAQATAWALTETAASAQVPSVTVQPYVSQTPFATSTEIENETPGAGVGEDPHTLIGDLWRVTLWGVLIFAGLAGIGGIILFIRQRRTNQDDEGLLL